MKTSTRTTAIIATAALATGAVAATAAVSDHQSKGEPSGMGQSGGMGHGQGRHGGGMGERAGKGQGMGSGGGMNGGLTLPAKTNTQPLSSSEAAAVTYMREEEKLARDVYNKLAETSGLPMFTRIATSEQRHMDALGRVLTRYNLPDPTTGNAAGAFKNPELQKLYTKLVARGSTSPEAATAVGRSIERLDIADLNKREATSKHSDVRWVFEQLERGSQMHLRAFTMQG